MTTLDYIVYGVAIWTVVGYLLAFLAGLSEKMETLLWPFIMSGVGMVWLGEKVTDLFWAGVDQILEEKS